MNIEELYNEYFKDVYKYLLSLCKNDALAQDLTSETFLRAIKNIDGFKGDCKIRVWLCQIAKNLYYDECKKNQKIEYTDVLPENTQASVSIEKQLNDKATEMKILKHIHILEEPYKEVFMLRQYGGYSFKEIAEVFNKKENWACVTYHRARNTLKNQLEGE